jgi:hypothetical protein
MTRGERPHVLGVATRHVASARPGGSTIRSRASTVPVARRRSNYRAGNRRATAAGENNDALFEQITSEVLVRYGTRKRSVFFTLTVEGGRFRQSHGKKERGSHRRAGKEGAVGSAPTARQDPERVDEEKAAMQGNAAAENGPAPGGVGRGPSKAHSTRPDLRSIEGSCDALGGSCQGRTGAAPRIRNASPMA